MIFDIFGNWRKLRETLGLSEEAPRSTRRISREKLLELAREQAALHGERLTQQSFAKAAGVTEKVIADRFGSWSELRQLLGLAPRARVQPRYSDEELIEDMYGVYRRTRRRPRLHQHQHFGGKIHPNTILKRFGTWAYACECLKERLQRELDEGKSSMATGLPTKGTPS